MKKSALSLALLLCWPASAQVVATVYTFGAGADGSQPNALVQGRNGGLYGTTFYGGSDGLGTIFQVSTAGNENILYNFQNQGGRWPQSGLMLATNGKFYGVTKISGGATFGVIFDISANGTFNDAYTFLGGSDEGDPSEPPIEASDGNLYGTTWGHDGGATVHPSTVYKLDRSGSLTTIYTFAKTQYPYGLIEGADGTLYGTDDVTAQGDGCGEIFKITTSGILLFTHAFTRYNQGPCLPNAGLIQASDGNFYGTTTYGGTQNGGTIYKLTQDGFVTVLQSFGASIQDGPPFGLVQATDGNLYAAAAGGTNATGRLLQMTLSGALTVIYNFPPVDPRYGGGPTSGLIQHTNGKFYRTADFPTATVSGEAYSLDMGLESFIAFVRPTGKVGQTAQILGQGLTGTTSLTFNGVPTTAFSIVSDTYMTAVVPAGATTGPMVVTTPTGTLISNVNFRISK